MKKEFECKCPQILTPKTISSVGYHDRLHCGNDWDTHLSVHVVSKKWYPWSKFYRLLGFIILGFYQVLSRKILPKSVVYGKKKKTSLIITQRIGLFSPADMPTVKAYFGRSTMADLTIKSQYTLTWG